MAERRRVINEIVVVKSLRLVAWRMRDGLAKSRARLPGMHEARQNHRECPATVTEADAQLRMTRQNSPRDQGADGKRHLAWISNRRTEHRRPDQPLSPDRMQGVDEDRRLLFFRRR